MRVHLTVFRMVGDVPTQRRHQSGGANRQEVDNPGSATYARAAESVVLTREQQLQGGAPYGTSTYARSTDPRPGRCGTGRAGRDHGAGERHETPSRLSTWPTSWRRPAPSAGPGARAVSSSRRWSCASPAIRSDRMPMPWRRHLLDARADGRDDPVRQPRLHSFRTAELAPSDLDAVRRYRAWLPIRYRDRPTQGGGVLVWGVMTNNIYWGVGNGITMVFFEAKDPMNGEGRAGWIPRGIKEGRTPGPTGPRARNPPQAEGPTRILLNLRAGPEAFPTGATVVGGAPGSLVGIINEPYEVRMPARLVQRPIRFHAVAAVTFPDGAATRCARRSGSSRASSCSPRLRCSPSPTRWTGRRTPATSTFHRG